MSDPIIVIFDEDPLSFQQVQRAFLHHDIQVLWGDGLEQSHFQNLECAVLLVSVTVFQDYERAYELHRYFPNAAMFLLSKQDEYDAFEARNAGAVGSFFKPLNIGRIYERLIEILPGQVVDGSLDSLYIPAENTRRAKLVSFMPTSPLQDDLEAIVQDILPVVVEQVLRVQLSASTPLRNLIQEEIKTLLNPKDRE